MSNEVNQTAYRAARKHPHSDTSSLSWRDFKRTKPAFGLGDEYTEEEQNALERAASILGTSLAGLIAGTRQSPSIATTDTDISPSSTSISDSLPSASRIPFNLKLPDFPKKASRSGNSNDLGFPLEPGAVGGTNGSGRGIDGWLSGFPTTSLGQGSVPGDGMEIPEQPSYNDWELNLVNNPSIWQDLGSDDWALENNPSPALPTGTCFDESFINLLMTPDTSMLIPTGTISLTPQTNEDGEIENKYTPTPRSGGKRKAQGTVTKTKRRGPFQDPQQRRETELTRKAKACLRCRMQRIRCRRDPLNPTGNCLTCLSVVGPTLTKLPCLRYRISDAQLIDHEACPRPSWSRRWKKMEIMDIKEWRSSETKVIRITQDVGGASYKLKVREFIPVEGDSLERKWVTHGEQQSFKCAPYAIENMKKAGLDLIKFVDDHLVTSICYYIDETNKLLRDTYGMACRYSVFAEREEERRLLKCVLRLWCASRMETRSDRICSNETLGMETQNYGPRCPNSGNILLPPVMTAQIEVIVTVMILLPMKKAVLHDLQELIQANRPGSWFTIYLCMFILLHSCALLTDADNKKAKKQGMQSRFFRTSLIEGLHNGAKILLGHFHYCNRGNHPFILDWTSREVIERAGLNSEQALFMRDTSAEIKKKADMFNSVRKNGIFEDELFFLSQLYDHEWKPIHTI